ncbi:MAG: aldolase catalytic domain-containing protein [Roseburia sp.]|nr:aldolase catalytic domain-containing protein [Roseburia sp.]
MHIADIKILDCTLRDGGYCNNWKFGHDNIRKIIRALVEANIDIIECGFVTEEVEADQDSTKFQSLEAISEVIPKDKAGRLFVCMINYGEYSIEKIGASSENAVDGIRVAFHKKDLKAAVEFCRKISEKGYKVFMQPMVSLNYSDEEFIELIRCANEIKPYAFYIVDSFGGMKERDLLRLFYIVENRLDSGIKIGFHSHNNMQLAYSNAKALTSVKTLRELIIDSSIYGMGRGAGNLNTELLTEYLNETEGKTYILNPILRVIDQVLNAFYQENSWGYSIPNYLSAKHNVHPNYANYLVDKQTLRIEDIDEIFAMMPEEKRDGYDKAFIKDLYYKFMENGKCYEEHLNEFREEILQRTILIIGPGKSVVDEKEKVVRFAEEKKPIIISVNFEYDAVDTDYIFVSNLRRYSELDEAVREKCIFTSNIPTETGYMKVRYASLLNNIDEVRDNAGLMLIQLLKNLGAKEVYIAGIDGYSHMAKSNYAIEDMSLMASNIILDARNRGMELLIREYSQKMAIHFITESKFAQ